MNPTLTDNIVKAVREQFALGDAAPAYDKRPYGFEQLEFAVDDLAKRLERAERKSP